MYSNIEENGMLIFCLPFRNFNSIRHADPTGVAPIFFIRLIDAAIVPPVARRSSMTTTFLFFFIKPLLTSMTSVPYSKSYETFVIFPGSFPFIQIIKKPQFSFRARGAAIKKPRDSIPAR